METRTLANEFSQRTTKAIGGAEASAGGLFRDLPISYGPLQNRDFQVHFNDFDNGLSSSGWDEADVGTQTLNPTLISSHLLSEPTGAIAMDSDATDGDGTGIYWATSGGNNQAPGYVLPAANKVAAFECRVKHEDWDAHHWFCGLAEHNDTTGILDANGDVIASTEYVGFHHNDDDDADGIPRLVAAGGNNTEVTTAPVTRNGRTITLTAGTDDTYRTMGIRIIGTDKIEWYLDGTFVAGATLASAFTGQLTMAFGNVMNAASGDRLTIDYVALVQTR